MARQIEVYVRKKKQIVRQYVTPPVWDGYQHHACMSKQVTEYENTLSDAETRALEILDELAKEGRIEFKIYDIATLGGKLRANLKGVTKTPAIIMNGEKIENISVELLKNKLHA